MFDATLYAESSIRRMTKELQQIPVAADSAAVVVVVPVFAAAGVVAAAVFFAAVAVLAVQVLSAQGNHRLAPDTEIPSELERRHS